MTVCIVNNCQNEAKGHFCRTCWAKLPWDKVAALTSARKTGYRRKEAVANAKKYLDDKINETMEHGNATDSLRD